MYKVSTALSIILSILLLSSCMNDSYKNCYSDTTLSLRYQYMADTGNNVLKQYIHSSIIYIYDEENLLIDSLLLDPKSLAFGTYLGVLPEGDYTFVSWANMGNQTETIFTDDLNAARLNTLNFIDDNNFTTNDPLYYAYKEVNIPRNFMTAAVSRTDTLTYKSAHINFRVIVRGIRDKDIMVTFNHLMPSYDFFMQDARPYETSYQPLVIEETLEEDGYKRLMELAVLRFKDKNQIGIELKDVNTGELLLPEVKLEELMKKNNVTVEDKQEVTILIEFKITDSGVKVDTREWDENEIIPEN